MTELRTIRDALGPTIDYIPEQDIVVDGGQVVEILLRVSTAQLDCGGYVRRLQYFEDYDF